jgi:hypothetical protein
MRAEKESNCGWVLEKRKEIGKILVQIKYSCMHPDYLLTLEGPIV